MKFIFLTISAASLNVLLGIIAYHYFQNKNYAPTNNNITQGVLIQQRQSDPLYNYDQEELLRRLRECQLRESTIES